MKRRASKACHCCRARKVRCDVVESGTPCTNCRLDQVECTVSHSKRQKKSYGDDDFLNRSPISSNEDVEDLPSFPNFEDEVPSQDLPPSLNGTLPPQTANAFEFDLNHHVPHMLCMGDPLPLRIAEPCSLTYLTDQTQGHRLTQEERKRRMSTLSQSQRTSLPAPLLMSPYTNCFSRPTFRTSLPLPRYVTPLPQRLLAEDIEYLDKKGAFTVPETSLRNELLRSYVQFVHPFCPVIDLKDFLTPIEQNDGTNQISLLLLQAVLFAGTAYVDTRFLHAHGYDNRKATRKIFWQRVRLLYDFDYESDRIALVQSLLLMTYWYETPDDQKDTWHWMGVSLSLAHTIGVHRNPEHSNLDLKRQRLWKRIWWSCFMRDRLIALGMRRPTRIKNEDFDVPILTLEDFDTEPLPNDLVKLLGGCPAVRDENKRIALAALCIDLVKLCKCVSHVLASQYSVLCHRLGGTMETTMMLVPKKSATQIDEVMACEKELDKWSDGLAPQAQYFVPGTRERANTTDGEVINLHRALLHMLYCTTSSALHRPQVLPSTPNMVIPADLQELSRRKVREAATEITEVARDLYVQDQIRYLPTSGVTVLLPAIIIHLLDVKSNDPTVRNTSMRRFYHCMQVLQRLREIYASADSAVAFIEGAIRKANIEVPLPTASRRSSTSASSQPVGLHHSPGMSVPTLQPQQNGSLTPPPEALHAAQKILHTSTITPEERSLFTALSPPRSDRSLNDMMTGDSAVMGTDGPDGYDDGFDDHDFDGRAEAEKNDFDALINFDAGADLFAAEDGLGVDIDMDWMAGLPHDGKLNDDTMGDSPDEANVSFIGH